ncbi:MAG TPA: NAD-dependent epimerase/dehydratase family protein [Polyangiaceae bacterium]|jgi:UDP-glucuronate 4-epimerase
MRWVVTGGVGFIGHHLCRALLARGDELVVVDDFSDAPYPRSWKLANQRALESVAPENRFRVVTACVTDREALRPCFEGADGVVHLAGLAGVRPSFRDPARYARVNVEGTAVTLELAREAGAKRYLFASSSSVYGNSTPLPAREDAPAIDPESPYAATKRSAELVASAIARISGDLRITALRFFTVYGPRQRPEMAITLFMRAALEGRPITLFGDGSMRRDFTHVDDIVRGVVGAMERAPAGFRAYNLGSGAPIRLDALVETIGQVAGKPLAVERAPVPAGDVDATFADVSRAQAELGYAPRVPLLEGLRTVRDAIRADLA